MVLNFWGMGFPLTSEMLPRTQHKKQAKGRSHLPPPPLAPKAPPWGSEVPERKLLPQRKRVPKSGTTSSGSEVVNFVTLDLSGHQFS